jgi:hypothetical protein
MRLKSSGGEVTSRSEVGDLAGSVGDVKPSFKLFESPGNEETLLHMAERTTAAQLERICRGYRQVTEDKSKVRGEQAAERRVYRQTTEGGMVRIAAAR